MICQFEDGGVGLDQQAVGSLAGCLGSIYVTLGSSLWIFTLGPLRQFLGSLLFPINFLGLNKSMDRFLFLGELSGGLSLQIGKCFSLTLIFNILLDVGSHHMDELSLCGERR